MNLAVDPIWSWPVVILSSTSLLVWVCSTYPSRIRHLPISSRRVLMGLRILSTLALCLAMFRPSLQFKETEENPSTIIFLADASRSMNIEDAPGKLSRRQSAIKLIEEIQPELEDLKENYDIQLYDFSSSWNSTEKNSEEAEGNQSAIGHILNQVREESLIQHVSAVFLWSDGRQQAIIPFDEDPREQSRFLGQSQIPIYTITVGGSGYSEDSLDLSVENLITDSVVFEKKAVPVNATVRTIGANGKKLVVRLLVEDRTGKKLGMKGKFRVPRGNDHSKVSMEITPTSNLQSIPVELIFVPDQPGEYKIAVEVKSIDGEIKTDNNRRETLITVRRGGVRVAYFDKPVRPESKFIRKIRTSDKIELVFQPVRSGSFKNISTIDPNLFARNQYDAYIIGDVPKNAFSKNMLKELAKRVKEGAGLLMTGGFDNFDAGGYGSSDLEAILPVKLSPLPPRSDKKNRQLTQSIQMIPFKGRQPHYIMRLTEGKRNLVLWKKLPPLKGANLLRKKSDFVQVLAESTEGDPLLFLQEYGKSRVMAFAGDTTYLWHLAGEDEIHQQFWRQMILWLTHKEIDGDSKLWVNVYPRNFSPGQRVNLALGARDDKGEKLDDVELTAEILKPNLKREIVSVQKGKDHESALFEETSLPGDYWVKVTGKRKGKPYGFSAWTRFIVDSRDPELENPASDPKLMNEIAELSGGASIPPEKVKSFLEDQISQNSFARADLEYIRQINLWDNWPFLGIFVGLLTIEWIIRKRRGLV
jgi:uncharacterized membrane protein